MAVSDVHSEWPVILCSVEDPLLFSKEEFRNAVIETIRRLHKAGEVAIGDTEDFGDYGLDSLDTMFIVLEVESMLNITFSEFDTANPKTIDALYENAREVMEGRT